MMNFKKKTYIFDCDLLPVITVSTGEGYLPENKHVLVSKPPCRSLFLPLTVPQAHRQDNGRFRNKFLIRFRLSVFNCVSSRMYEADIHI